MQKKILIALLFTLSLMGNCQAGVFTDIKEYFWPSEKPPQLVSILILHDQPGALLEVKGGKYRIYDPYTNALIDTRFIGKRKYIQPMADGLKWGEEFPSTRQIKIVPDNDTVTTLIDGIEYPGTIYVYDIGGSVSIVNELTMEEYLLAVLGPQFKEPLTDEALAAVAIVARTNALYQIQKSRSPFWNIDAKAVAYEGLGDNNPACPMGLAIRNTNKMVMSKNASDAAGIVAFPAQWGSSTGGKSAPTHAEYSRISIYEADRMASRGSNAAQILNKAFPESKIMLIATE